MSSLAHFNSGHGGRNAGSFEVSSGILFHGKLNVVLHVHVLVVAKHRDASGSRCDLLHPLSALLNCPVVVNLTFGWLYWHLDHVLDRRFFLLVRSCLLHRLVIVHLAFKVAEVFDLFLLLELLGLLDLQGEDHVGAITFLKSSLHLLDKVNLLALHLSDLITENHGLPLVVFHVALNVLLASRSVLIKLNLLSLNSLFVQLELALLFTHLVSKLLQHLNLFASFFIHNCSLLR